jgi:hypothetical protein
MNTKLSLTVLAVVAAALGVASALSAAGGGMGPGMGPMTSAMRPAFHGFYDGHKDTFLSTDVSDAAQAKEMHVNVSASLARVGMAASDDIYLFVGTAAAGQLPVFGSEPGEKDYTPLWHENLITWKAGMTPTLLKSDTAVEAAVKAGKVTEQKTHIILNCPIVHVAK